MENHKFFKNSKRNTMVVDNMRFVEILHLPTASRLTIGQNKHYLEDCLKYDAPSTLEEFSEAMDNFLGLIDKLEKE